MPCAFITYPYLTQSMLNQFLHGLTPCSRVFHLGFGLGGLVLLRGKSIATIPSHRQVYLSLIGPGRIAIVQNEMQQRNQG